MKYFAGEQKLKLHAKQRFFRNVEPVCENVYFFTGFGGSNMIALIGDDSCVLIDALNGKEVAQAALTELRKLTDKPVSTIIYTHHSVSLRMQTLRSSVIPTRQPYMATVNF